MLTYLAAGSSMATGLAGWITGTLGTILLVIVGAVAVKFLFAREMLRFFQFIALALLIFLVAFHGALLVNLATEIAHAMGA